MGLNFDLSISHFSAESGSSLDKPSCIRSHSLRVPGAPDTHIVPASDLQMQADGTITDARTLISSDPHVHVASMRSRNKTLINGLRMRLPPVLPEHNRRLLGT